MVEDHQNGGRQVYMQRRVQAFINSLRPSPLYDFKSFSPESRDARTSLDAAIQLYGEGELDEAAVESFARLYVQACKRKGGGTVMPQHGSRNPPPQSGTYSGKTQANLVRKLARPIDVRSLASEPELEGESNPITSEWRVCLALRDLPGRGLSYFQMKDIDAGDTGYARIHPTQSGAIIVLGAIFRGLSYYFYLENSPVECYQPALDQTLCSAAWTAGFVAKK